MVANGLFARAKEDGANAVVQEAGATVSRDDLERTINRITADFALRLGRPNPVPIKKVRAFGFPHAILASTAVQGVQASATHILNEPVDKAGKRVFHKVTSVLIVVRSLGHDMP